MRKQIALYLLLISFCCTAQVQYDSITEQSFTVVLQKIEAKHNVKFSYRDKNVAEYKIDLKEGNYNIDTLITLFEALEREVVVSTKRINKVNQ